jgi:hypothetical protein
LADPVIHDDGIASDRFPDEDARRSNDKTTCLSIPVAYHQAKSKGIEGMTRININRVVLGGLVAAIVLFVVSGIVNGAILGPAWQAWLEAMGSLNHAPSPPAGMVIWAVVSLVFGLTGVWIYAAIRPRYGAGWQTALLAGFMLWLAGWLAPALGQVALGAIPTYVTVVGCAGGLAGALLAVLAGAATYKEA